MHEHKQSQSLSIERRQLIYHILQLQFSGFMILDSDAML